MTLFSLLTAVGSDWKGFALTCHFSATADGVPLAVADDTKPFWSVPTTATTVTITATPTVPTFWPTTVTFDVGNTGALTPAGPTAAFVTVKDLHGAGVVLSFATVVLSRFKDVSDDVLKLLANPPATRQGRPAHVLQDYKDTYGVFPPQDWDLDDKPDAHFLDLPNPPQVVQGVSFSKDTSVHVDAENVVLRLAGVVAPKLWGVSWPATIDRNDAQPTPILLFLRQGNAQYIGSFFSGDGLGPYPDNFDYASFGLFDDMAYPEVDPFNQPGSKGVPYQAAKAGAKAVTVHPVNSLNEDFGVIESTKQMGRILLELQAFMFRRAGIATPPTTLGKTAIASFSSGTHILARILASPDNRGETFLNDTVNAVYFLDAPAWSVGDCVVAALAWAGAPERDKRVRFYTQDLWDPLKKVLPSPLPKEPFLANSPDNLRTLGLVSRTSWIGFVKNAINVQLPAADAWQYVHHATAAMLLTHALAQDDFS